MKFDHSPLLSFCSFAAFFYIVSNDNIASASVFDNHFRSIGNLRVDPILDQECLSDHVHSFYGAKSLWPTTNYTDLRSVPPSENSGPIKENNSLYWHPSIYRRKNNGKLELQEMTMGVYYIWDPDANVTAFPPGFTMIAGRGGPHEHAGYSMECDGDEESASTEFPDEPCPGEFSISFRMPNCWKEGILWSSDDSHVKYTIGGSNEADDRCPDGYIRIPQLWIFIEMMDYKGGVHFFSDGTQNLHIDYMNGWEDGKLAEALKSCDNGTLDPIGGKTCPQFTYKDDELYAPPEPFPTKDISAEKVTNIRRLKRGRSKTRRGTCRRKDIPKELSAPGIISAFSPPGPSPTTDSPIQSPVPDDIFVDDEELLEQCFEECSRILDECFMEVEDNCRGKLGYCEHECDDEDDPCLQNCFDEEADCHLTGKGNCHGAEDDCLLKCASP